MTDDRQRYIDALQHTDYYLVFMGLQVKYQWIRSLLNNKIVKNEVQKTLDAGLNPHLAKPQGGHAQ